VTEHRLPAHLVEAGVPSHIAPCLPLVTVTVTVMVFRFVASEKHNAR
jgi:hypothetical protein